jgi:ATP-dependent Clp protease adapter protein ClpS
MDNLIKDKKTKKKIENIFKKEEMYYIMLHNNPITPFEFVVDVLDKTLKIGSDQANRIMMKAHTEGQASCYQNAKAVCEKKLIQIEDYINEKGTDPVIAMLYQQLKFTVEKES